MKKITLLTFFLMLMISGGYAQCINFNQYPYDIVEVENTGAVEEISSCNYTGEYSLVEGILIGEDYVFSITHPDDGNHRYITITDQSDTVIGFGMSPLTVSNMSASTIKIHYTENDLCANQNECYITTIQILLTCPVPVNTVVSNITTTSATFNWQAGGEETSWEVLALPTGSPAPTSTTNGTPVTQVPTYVFANLIPATQYVFYVRANCGTEFSPWTKFKFATGCDPIAVFEENFDATPEEELPVCWSAIVGGPGISEYAQIKTIPYNGTDDSHSVLIERLDSDPEAHVILVSPALSTLSLGTHRLKFKTYSYEFVNMEIGTLSSAVDGSTFTVTGQAVTISPGYKSHTIDFSGYTGTNPFIGLRLVSGYSVFVDDVRWEVAPLCPDITQIEVANATINSISLDWENGGTEAAWDLVYSTDLSVDPNTLTATASTLSAATITGLLPGTTYYFWVRSACGAQNGNGFWSEPISFTTPCEGVATLNENFDTTEIDQLPNCWSKIIKGNQVTEYDSVGVTDWNSQSSPQAVTLQKDMMSTEIILVSPNLSTLPLGTHRLKFYGRSWFETIEVGTLNSPTNQGVFTPIQEIELGEEFIEYKVDFAEYTTTDTYIGIRLVGSSATLDDIRWEISPLCPDVEDLQITDIDTTSASLTWTTGGTEESWDVVYSQSSNADLSTLTPISTGTSGVNEATITNLSPFTTYYAWVRSHCDGPDGLGAWIGPISFTTACLPIDLFSESFETTAYGNLADCWTSIIRGNDVPGWTNVSTVDFNSATGIKSVLIDTEYESNSTDNDVILVSPKLSTLSAGTHRLKFKKYTNDGAIMEIGTLDSSSPNANFSLWEEVDVTSNYSELAVDFTSYTGTDTYIGFRYKSGSAIFLDDIRWEVSPLCPDVIEIEVSDIMVNNATLTWSPGGSETSWDIVYTDLENVNPSTLTPTNILNNPAYDFTNLAANTLYTIWIRSVCNGTDGNGAWIGPLTFRTNCNATNVPYFEDFESADNYQLPLCTSNQNINGSDNNWGISYNPGYGFENYTLTYGWWDSEADVFFFTQGINLTAGTQYTISYKYGNNSDMYTEKLRVLYGMNANSDSMIDELADHPEINQGIALTNSVTFTPPTTGIYYFGFQAYSAPYQYNLLVDDILIDVALEDKDFTKNTFKFYPNPVKDILHLSYDQNISTVVVYNLLGQLIMERNINSNSTSLDMSHLNSGTYLVKVTSDKITKTIKVIKE